MPSRLIRSAVCVVLAVAVITVGSWHAAVYIFSGARSHIQRDDSRITVTSPDNTTQWTLSVNDRRLTWRVERNGALFMDDSPLGVTLGADNYGTLDNLSNIGAIRSRLAVEQRRILGRTAVADTPCVQTTMAVEGDCPFELEVWVFDNGVAFRYRLPDNGNRGLKSEETAFALPPDTAVWAGEAHPYYETVNVYQNPTKPSSVLLGTPATLKIGENHYAAILEGDLKNYPGMKLSWLSANRYGTNLGSRTTTMSGTVVTPWRIVAVADSLNELVNNTIVYQVCDPADEATFGSDWVTPGRAAWSWISTRSTEAVTPAALKEYTENAARLGFEYNIIDEGWIHWNNSTRALERLVEQGDRYGIGQILWTGVTAGASFSGGIDTVEDAYAFLDFLGEHGLAGGKIDFFPEESDLTMGINAYRDILSYAAQKELVINFHGCNKPSGYDVTFPNELNREAILGLESTAPANRRIQAQMFVTQPFVRNLAGHADFTPAVDTAFHMAQLVLTDAPMQAIAADPADLLEAPTREMIKSVPTVWENTVVLPQSRIGQAAVIARQSTLGSWYVGGINYQSEVDSVTLDLSEFLQDGTYRLELWTDVNNRPVCDVRTVSANDTLTVPFSKLSGFLLRLDRVTLSQYGGEITGPVTVTVTNPNTAVSYAFDNGDGKQHFRPLASGESVTLSESGVLTLKITDGPDKGRVASWRFNRIAP